MMKLTDEEREVLQKALEAYRPVYYGQGASAQIRRERRIADELRDRIRLLP